MPDIWFPHLNIQIQHLDSVAFTIYGVDIMWYGITMALGVVAGLRIAVLEARRIGYDTNILLDYLTYGIIFGIIGARIYFVIFSWSDYKDNLLHIFALREGGLAFYGTIIACVITAIVYTRVKKLDFWQFVDIAAPGPIIGQMIGRIGNFINREVFGGYTDSILAMRYKADQVPVIPPQLRETIFEVGGVAYLQVQPTFLYEILWNLGTLIFIQLYKRHKKFNGEILGIYVLSYGIGRFWIEGIRTDQLYIGSTTIPVSQVVSVVLALAAIVFIVYKRRKIREIKGE